MEVRNATYTAEGKIDCELHHDELGWIPYTASNHDVEVIGKEVFELCEQGIVTPYTPADVSIDDLRNNHWKRLEADMHKYIFDVHDYPEPTQITLVSIYNDPDSNAAQRAACKTIFDWVKTVLAYYYQRKAAIVASDDPESLTWDFHVSCDATAPGYTLAQIIQMT